MKRRDLLIAGSAGVLGLTLPAWLRAKEEGAVKPGARAKSVIQIWLAGGPAHTDTFDPKPESGPDYCGALRRALPTSVAGMRVGELMPLMAKQAAKYTILRGMTHANNAHETAAYIMQTGTLPSSELVYPSVGAVVAFQRSEAGYASSLPPYITLTNPLGRFSEAGFLGNNYKTFATGGDPNSADFRVQGIVPPRGMTDERLRDRQALLRSVDALAKDAAKQPRFRDLDTYQEKAFGLLLGEARKAFDLSLEKDDLRQRYGRNHFGQSCLLARRLVENGVPFVTVNDAGWDTHKNHFEAMQRKLPVLDAGLATLIEDLSERGLLDSTIVTCFGEFGRTPRIAMEPPWFGGRHHFANCFSAVVAGGGFAGGQVLGATDARGENVLKRPVYPWDLSASMYELLGIDPAGRLPHPNGCVAYVTPIGSASVQSGGLLREIMRGSS